jgi:glycosyltransferase involved in cell wall biosynthesis
MNHILLVTTSFPDVAFAKGQEAAGTFVYDFAQALAKQVKVTVVAPSLSAGVEQAGNITIHRFAAASLPLSLLKPTNPKNWFAIWRTMQAGQATVQQVVDTEEIDHIFALWALPSGYWAGKTGMPYSVWALGSDIWGMKDVPILRTVLKRVLQNSQICFADGYQLGEDVTEIAGIPCHFLPSSRQLYPTLPPKRTQPPYRLAFLGRWHPNKGADLLLEALNLLTDADWEKIEQVRYCGGGPLEGVVNAGITQLQAQGRPIVLEGFLDKTQATALFDWADYLLLPSRIESIPVIFSDAMQCGLPLISTPVGDLPRLLNNYQSGVLATDTTSLAFAQAIQKTLTLSAAHLQASTKHAAQDFRLEQTTQQWLKHI